VIKKHQKTYDIAKLCSKKTLAEVLSIFAANSLVDPDYSASLISLIERKMLVEQMGSIRQSLSVFNTKKNLLSSDLKTARSLIRKFRSMERRLEKISALVTK
jgi:hypothetical protein